MPKYFFDIEQDGKMAADAVGLDLPDDAAAREEAIRTISEIAKDEIAVDGPQLELAMIVRLDGSVRFRLHISYEISSGR